MRPAPPALSPAEIRAIVLRSQGLADDPAPFGTGKSGVLSAIQHLGYVQVDTINVLQRAHHHVLWSRVPDYRPEMLHELQSPDAGVFEYWAHAASYLATSDYRFSLPLMRQFRKEMHWSKESPELLKSMRRLLSLTRKKGPLMISDVESTSSVQGWGAFGKIERRALHELWMRGEIMIRSRKGFQKVFDLPERVLPADTNTRLPTKREAGEFHLRQMLRAAGVARLTDLNYLRNADHKSITLAALKTLLRQGEVVELRSSADGKTPLFALQQALTLGKPLTQNHVRFLSPFDNLIIQRKRLKWLFDFDYTVEIYVPAAKRLYGYFVLPILWGDRLVGRMDAKAVRPERKLVIHNLVFEPAFQDWKALKPAFEAALQDFLRFQDCDTYEVTRVEPKAFRIK
jgi:uncharacterized protein YcaQ